MVGKGEEMNGFFEGGEKESTGSEPHSVEKLDQLAKDLKVFTYSFCL